ncbi:MAG: hypothetical protein WBZ30_19645, partial [Bradyrhizobium sp.]
MLTISVLARRSLRVLGAAAALLMVSAIAGQRADALPPVNPGMATVSKAVADGRTIEVRGGGHGGGRGGGGAGFGRGF